MIGQRCSTIVQYILATSLKAMASHLQERSQQDYTAQEPTGDACGNKSQTELSVKCPAQKPTGRQGKTTKAVRRHSHLGERLEAAHKI